MFRSVMHHLQGGTKINKIRHNVIDIKSILNYLCILMDILYRIVNYCTE
jgi:hypothetical protein